MARSWLGALAPAAFMQPVHEIVAWRGLRTVFVEFSSI
jgi:hypothetical protein